MKRKLLRKLGMIILTTAMLTSVVGCGGNNGAGQDNVTAQTEGNASAGAAEATNGTTSAGVTAPADGAASTDPTASGEKQDANAGSVDVWIPAFMENTAAATEKEDIYAKEIAIASKGTFLFSGKTNESYSGDGSWLKDADSNSSIVVAYACDDATHGGWGVLGGGSNVNGKWNQFDIAAYSDDPTIERVVVYTMDELAAALGAGSISELEGFSLGAWNGGRIAGLYFLDATTTEELLSYMESTDKANLIVHTYDGSLSDPNAIESAVVVYDYLKSVYGTACITGQMESTWMGSPDHEMNYIEKNTGKLPAIRGLDFMHNDFDGVVLRAKAWWEKGGIPTICWHTGADFASGYTESLNDDIDFEKALTPGTQEYAALIDGMDRAVPYLQQLEDAGVPVLWRPFHELDGGWFWWSKGGSESFVNLWKLMYCRYVDYWGLDNLIWVYGYTGECKNAADWYPGDEYVDLVGADSYTPGANADSYRMIEKISAPEMPIVFHECGTIPTEAELKEAGTDWLFFMVWHTDYLTDEKNNTKASLNDIYNSDYFITLDELPSFK